MDAWNVGPAANDLNLQDLQSSCIFSYCVKRRQDINTGKMLELGGEQMLGILTFSSNLLYCHLFGCHQQMVWSGSQTKKK